MTFLIMPHIISGEYLQDYIMTDEFIKKAVALHWNNPVVDAHLDLPGEILYRVRNGEKDIIKNYYMENWKYGGINIIVASVFVEDMLLPEMGLRNALDQIAAINEEISRNDNLHLIRNVNDLNDIIAKNEIGIILFAEGLDFIGNDINLLDILFELGVRGVSLTWSRSNAFANGCCKAGQLIQHYGGLSTLGMKAVERIEKLSMFLDVSHLNDDGFKEVSIIAKKPFVATHSCSRTIHFNYRNLTDEQLLILKDRGGIAGVNGCRLIVGERTGEGIVTTLCRHVEHEVNIMGAEHVGFGFDFCDSYDCARYRRKYAEEAGDALVDHSGIVLLTASLIKRGMSEMDAVRIIGMNFVEYFRKILPENR